MDKHLYIKVWNGEGVEATPFPSAQNPARLDEFQFESTRMGAAPEIRAELMWPTCLDNEWTDNVFVEFDGEKYFLYHRPSSEKNNEDERWHYSISFRSERSLLAGIYVYDAVEGDDSPASNNTTVRYSGQLDGFIQKLNASLNVSELSSRFLVVVDDGIETEDKTLTFEDKYFNEALSDAVETWGVPYYIFNSEVSGKTEIHFGHYKTEIGDAQHPLTYRTEGLTMTKKEHSGNDVINRATGYGSNENLPWYYPNESDSGSHELGGTLNVPGQTKVDYNALSRNFENFAANNETVCWYKGYPYIVRPSFCEIFFRDTDVSKTYYDVPVRAVYAQWPEYAYNEQSGTPGYYPIFEQNKPSIVNEAFKPLQYGRLYDAYATVGFIFYLEAGQTIHMEPDIKLNLNSVNINVDSAAATKYTKVVKISGSSANIETQLSNYMLNRGHSGPVDGHRNNVEIDNEFLFTMLQDGQGTDLTEDSGKFEFTASENGLYLFEFRRRFPIPNSVPTSRQNVASFVFGLNRDLYFDIEAPHFRRMTEDTGHEMIYQDKGYILGIKANPEDGDELTISKTDWDAWMTPQPNLMPEIYRLSILDRVTNPSHPIRRFYNAKNYPFVPAAGYAPDIIAGEYIDQNDGKVYNRYYFDTEGNPYLFGFPFSEKKPVEHIGRYDEIKASITGIENSDHEPIDEFLAIAYDEHDNNRFVENKEGDSETMEHPYFFVKLPKMPFNLFSCVGTEPAVISMTSGNCAACKFQILVQKDNNKNTVQVDDYGNLKRDNNGNVVFGSPQDEQQNTQTHEVWIALQKDISTYGSAQPRPFAGQQTEEGIKPEVGDKYVITGIWMPFEYILEAERRLSQQIVTDVHNNNFHKFNSGIDFSRIYLEENAEILSKLCDSAKIWVKHNNTDPAVGLYVSSFRYSMTTDALPEITVELADSLIPEQSSIQLIESRVTKAVQNMSAPAAKPITSAELSSTTEEPVILKTNKGRSAIPKNVLLDNLGFEQKGNIDRPVFINEERKAEEIEGLNLPENIRTEKNVEAMGGVAAHGMATLQRGGGGGIGTVTGIKFAGDPSTIYEPSQGLITLPDYPTAASLISDGLASQSYVQSYFSDNFTQANIKSTLGISDWALASTKPSYNFSEIGSKPTTLAGYGITDAHITSGVITLGGNTITPATLTNGKIPLSQIPDAILGQLIYGGTVNGSGVVTLSQNAMDKWGITSLTLTSSNYADYEGAFFIASADGTSGVPSTLGLLVGDWVVATASGWGKIDNTDAVTGIKGDAESSYRIGNVNITKGNIGLGNVENTALSTWAGTSNITTLGTITTGVWNGTAIGYDYLASGVQTSLGKADTVRGYFDTNGLLNKANHYSPASDSSADYSASASGATAAWSIDVVKGVQIQRDAKGHILGVTVTSGKIPAKPTYAFSDLTSHPNTLSGYGITDGVNGLQKSGSGYLSDVGFVEGNDHSLLFTFTSFAKAQIEHTGGSGTTTYKIRAKADGAWSDYLALQQAGASAWGIVTDQAQTFGGDKTFNGNIQSMKGVAARGMATLQRSGGGGSGTLTEIQINGTTVPDSSGIVNITALSDTNGQIKIAGQAITINGWQTVSDYSFEGHTAYGWGNHANAGYLLASTAASTYLPLSGGIISTSDAAGLAINTTHPNEAGIRFSRNSTTKAWIGYHDSFGVYLYNSARGGYLYYTDTGALNFENNVVLHSGNYSNYALPLSGGTLSNDLYESQLTIKRSTYAYDAVIKFENANGYLGSIGIGYNGIPYITFDHGGTTRAILHSGNYSSYLNGVYAPYNSAGYLPLSGGTVTGLLTLSNDNYASQLTIHRGATGDAMINFSNNNGALGKLGIIYTGSPTFVNASGTEYALLHAGNYSSYALPLSGGTINSSSVMPLLINSTASGGSVYTQMRNNNTMKVEYGYWYDANSVANSGVYLQGLYNGIYNTLMINDDGVLRYNGNTIWHAGNDGSGSGLDADLLDGYNSSAFVRHRENGYCYTDVASGYSSGTTVKYWRVALPDNSASWAMIQMEFNLIEQYSAGRSGKIIVYGNWSSGQEWNQFNAFIYGNLSTNIKVYGSNKKYIYIYTNLPWETLVLSKMICSDNITSHNISAVAIDYVDSLPATYQTASMYSNIDSGNISSQSVAYATSAGDADTLDGQHGSYYAAASALSNYLPLAGGTMTGKITFDQDSSHRDRGIVGRYDYTKYAAIWAMGASYQIAADGSSLGSLYGAAYMYNSQYYGCDHQFVWAENGSIKAALGEYVWSDGGFKKNGSDNNYVLLGGGGHAAISGLSVNYASSAGNADTVDGKHASEFFYNTQVDAPQDTTYGDSPVSWAESYAENNPNGHVYNSYGVEYSYLMGMNANKNYGSILKFGYADQYIRILRKYGGSWATNDWEKISAGYADSAGDADTVDGEHSSAFVHKSGDESIYGLKSFCNRSNSASYMNAAIQIREYNFGGSQDNNWGIAPRLAFHWAGRVQAQIGLSSDNHLYISEDGDFSYPQRIYTDSYHPSADTLTTSRSLWGQSFNGTGDVSGDMSNVGWINSVVHIGYQGNARLYIQGVSDSLDYLKMNVSDSGATQRHLILQDYGGNVGIGTSPATKLDVAGDVKASGYGLFGGASGIYIGATYSGSSTGYDCIERAGSGNTLFMQYYHAGGMSLCYGGGNVSIGYATASQSYKLDVNGSFRAGLVEIPTAQNIINSLSGYALYLNATRSDNVLLAYGGGNVGIGTASPSYKLHVAGDIYANGGWLRTSGAAGWYSETYGGGWYCDDYTYVKTYGSRSIYTANNVLAGGNIVANGGVAARGMATLQSGAGAGNPVTQINVGSTAYTPSNGVVSLPAYPTWSTLSGKPTNVSAFTNDSGYIDSSALAVTFTTTTLTSSSTSVYLNNTISGPTFQKINISSANNGQQFTIYLKGSGSYYGHRRQVLIYNNSGQSISVMLAGASYIDMSAYLYATPGGIQTVWSNPIDMDNQANQSYLLDITEPSANENPTVIVHWMSIYAD